MSKREAAMTLFFIFAAGAQLVLEEAKQIVVAKNMYRGYYQAPEEAEEIADKLNTNAAEVF